MLRNALSRYTSSGGFRRHLSRCGSVRRGSWFPPGTNSIPRPCFAALKGKAERTAFARIPKHFPLCTPFLSLPLPVAPVPPGVSGGGAALSSLCRRPFLRRDNESHFAAQSPECAFLAKPFFAQAKTGVNLRRRSHKISFTKAKTA